MDIEVLRDVRLRRSADVPPALYGWAARFWWNANSGVGPSARGGRRRDSDLDLASNAWSWGIPRGGPSALRRGPTGQEGDSQRPRGAQHRQCSATNDRPVTSQPHF